MDIKRIILYSALILTVFSLWNAWKIEYPDTPRIKKQASQKVQSKDGHLLPQVDVAKEGQERSVSSVVKEETTDNVVSKPINVETDVLSLIIDLKHGDIINAKLLDYPVSLEEKDKPIELLTNKKGERYVANSSLLVAEKQKVKPASIRYTTEKDLYRLMPNQDKLVVTLKGNTEQGLQVKKEFVFKRNSYLINIRYILDNTSDTSWKGYLNTQLLRSSPKEDKSSIFHIGSFTGASYSNPGEKRYQKVSFADMEKQNLNINAKGGWIAMQQHYFLSAWIPDENKKNKFYTRSVDDSYTIGAVSKSIIVQPDSQKTLGTRLYVGPEITTVLKSISPTLDMTVDYGMLWFISSPLFLLMKAIYKVVGNWGWSIVLVTVLIKIAFYPLSATSYRSMAGMRKLQPKLQALRERYGDDKAKISQATMELYRQEKVNPLGGCLPILIQIPVFIALYWVLLESVELRQAPFILWIHDLASADPYHVLPIIMGATMLIQQKLNPAPPDPVQAKMMMLLPILFTALFWNFPAGLVLYWIVNNTLSILQQWYITQKYSDDKSGRKKLAAANK